jgi:hypothetical protein
VPESHTHDAPPTHGDEENGGGITGRFIRRRQGGRQRGATDRIGPDTDKPDPPLELGRFYPSCAPELGSSRLGSQANFVHVALAALFGHEAAQSRYKLSEQDSLACRERLPGLLDAYERKHGQIRGSYFARNAFAATALTDRDEFDIVWGTQESIRNPRCVTLLLRCQQLSYTGWHRLHDNDRRHCQNLVFAVAVEIIRRMDSAHQESPAANGETDDGVYERLEHELDSAEDFMLRSAGRRAQIRYVKGMLWGLLPMLALVAAVVAIMEVFGVSDTLTSEVALVAVAGALGALVSVLLRMTVGHFSMNLPTLDADMRNTDLRLIGMLRPAVGALCGLAAYSFIQAALVPVESKGDGPEVFLYMAIGFLSGFSERFFQDMFARSGQGLLGSVGDAPSSGPAAGLSPPPGRAKADQI